MQRITIALLLLLAQPVWAAMSLDKMVIHLDAAPNAREDVVVSNPDNETIYVQTEVYRVDHPGRKDEKKVLITDPRDFKLLVSPSKAVIPAGASKRFRLMSVETGIDNEKVYRVTFKPVVGKITSKATGVKILVAYQALIFVQPKDGAYQLALHKFGDHWQLANRGNINVEVRQLRFCRAQGDCEALPSIGRLYAGAHKDLKLPADQGYLKLNAFDGSDGVEKTFPL
ncbi:fimbria/pilus periplasmic chaperone [Microbulbifer sp. SAOS-129_SWC]|uniref:fimbrial biogenesis chaperone n=1 Tax=Microbulbifer sp. SAOS-129_SWC TaxID=3145235 RepID=UPI0032176290